jgi:hypothetical protein
MRRGFFNHRGRRGHRGGVGENTYLLRFYSSVISAFSVVNISGLS